MKAYRNSKIRKAAATLAFCLAFSGCGAKADEVVTDYGDQDISSEEATSEDVEAFLQADGEDGAVNLDLILNEDFEEGGISYNIFSTYSKETNLNNLKKYTVAKISDSEETEQKIVESIFGDTGKQVKTISNEKAGEFVSFLNKYKTIKSIIEKEPRNKEYDNFECVVNYDEDTVPTPGDAQSYDWVDNDNYYIHIYEGQYEGARFGLMIAYDKVEQARYIYFNPVNIEEYYPGKNLKTVMLRNSVDMNGNPCVGNECTLSPSDVEEQVGTFLSDKLGISDYEAELGNDYNSYSMRSRPVMGFVGEEQGNRSENSISQIVFSNSDFAHSVIDYEPTCDMNGVEAKNTDQFPRSVEILAEQDDRIGDALRKGKPFLESLWDPYKYLDWNEELDEKIEYTYDGYALYLNPGFLNNYNPADYSSFSQDYIESAPINSGVVEVTSKGIFGVDIVQMLHVDEAYPARILKADKIKDALIEILKSEEFTGEIGDNDMVFTTGSNLIYYYNESSSTYAPAWDFPIQFMSQKDVKQEAEFEVVFEEPDMHIYVDAETGDLLEVSK